MSALSPTSPDAAAPAWKILVVDDEPAIHQVTRLALRNLVALGRPSQLINALSAADAREQLQRHPDIALILLDVVMETEHAGLNLVRYIREEQGNGLLRIILRTGQPGQAPERTVMVDYDINDYKEKTELTANKLFTTVLAALRTYQHVASLARLRLAVDALGGLGADVFAAADRAQLAQALTTRFLAAGLAVGVSCTDANGQLLASVGAGGPPLPQGGLHEAARRQPGVLQLGDQEAWLSLTPANGEALMLGLALEPAPGEQDEAVLTQLALSAKTSVAHWRH